MWKEFLFIAHAAAQAANEALLVEPVGAGFVAKSIEGEMAQMPDSSAGRAAGASPASLSAMLPAIEKPTRKMRCNRSRVINSLTTTPKSPLIPLL
jgi:hypothetical protein